jgi:hypothetical protein
VKRAAKFKAGRPSWASLRPGVALKHCSLIVWFWNFFFTRFALKSLGARIESKSHPPEFISAGWQIDGSSPWDWKAEAGNETNSEWSQDKTAKIELCVIRQVFESIKALKDRTNPVFRWRAQASVGRQVWSVRSPAAFSEQRANFAG